MSRVVVIFLLLVSSLFGAKTVESIWREDLVFSQYLEESNISTELIQAISEEDRQFLSEIQVGERFFELYSEKGELLQALIPIGKEMQIQLLRNNTSGIYSFDIIPILYQIHECEAVFTIETTLQEAVLKATHNAQLAYRLGLIFGGDTQLKVLQKGDKIAVLYSQKERLGRVIDIPQVIIAVIQRADEQKFFFDQDELKDDEDKEEKAQKKESPEQFIMPIRHVRITSKFSYSRWHPILRRYRPHFGVDFGARKGTPLLAAAPGKVVFAGWMGGYGKVIKIRHRQNYTSLYAHLSTIRVQDGDTVMKGQMIGHVGNTGRSTGSHLHFGLYKNGQAIDPMKLLGQKAADTLKTAPITTYFTKKQEAELAKIKENKAKILKILNNPSPSCDWSEIKDNFVWSDQKEQYADTDKG
jgi:murein DD-endopeptidase MepM/ murein hydrolase activator NlpD